MGHITDGICSDDELEARIERLEGRMQDRKTVFDQHTYNGYQRVVPEESFSAAERWELAVAIGTGFIIFTVIAAVVLVIWKLVTG